MWPAVIMSLHLKLLCIFGPLTTRKVFKYWSGSKGGQWSWSKGWNTPPFRRSGWGNLSWEKRNLREVFSTLYNNPTGGCSRQVSGLSPTATSDRIRNYLGGEQADWAVVESPALEVHLRHVDIPLKALITALFQAFDWWLRLWGGAFVHSRHLKCLFCTIPGKCCCSKYVLPAEIQTCCKNSF